MGKGSDVKKYNSMLKKVFLILALFPMAATVCLTVHFVLPGIKDPGSLLKFSRTWYVVLSFVLFVLWTGVVVLLVRLESRLTKQNSRGTIVLASIINAAALLWLLFSLILSAIGFSDNVGIIRISNAEELSYIRNYPSGEYVLTKDIDMEGEEWKSISKFIGSINGNGHSIINITVGKNGFIKENLGKISSLTLSLKNEEDQYTITYTDSPKEYTEYLPLKESDPEKKENDNQYEYVETERTGEIPINEKHQYTIVSFTEPSFWEIGYNNCVCELCGRQYYSLRVDGFNWVFCLSLIIIVVSVITIFCTLGSEGCWGDTFETVRFWVSAILFTLAAGTLIYYRLFVYPYQVDGEHSYEQLAFDPTDDCRLTETGRTEATYEEKGTVTYTCGDCGKEYVEYLPLGEFDQDQAAIYVESPIIDVTETPNNGSVQGATDVPLFSKVTGRLTSEKDLADYYRFTLNTAGNMKFKFSHDGDAHLYHWDATIYDTDGTTVLNEGYIDSINSDEFVMSNLNAGTYYLKISRTTGMNPLLYSFSDANYYITFMPECIEHPSTTQYFYEIPTCKEAGEAVNVCDECKTIIAVDEIKPLEHRWSGWTITKEASITSAGEKSRNCLNCDEVQYGVLETYIWVIPLAVIELILSLAGVIYFFSHITGTGKSKGGAVVMILLLIEVFAVSSTGIINTPALVAEPVKKMALTILLALNILNIIGAIATMLKN